MPLFLVCQTAGELSPAGRSRRDPAPETCPSAAGRHWSQTAAATRARARASAAAEASSSSSDVGLWTLGHTPAGDSAAAVRTPVRRQRASPLKPRSLAGLSVSGEAWGCGCQGCQGCQGSFGCSVAPRPHQVRDPPGGWWGLVRPAGAARRAPGWSLTPVHASHPQGCSWGGEEGKRTQACRTKEVCRTLPHERGAHGPEHGSPPPRTRCTPRTRPCDDGPCKRPSSLPRPMMATGWLLTGSDGQSGGTMGPCSSAAFSPPSGAAAFVTGHDRAVLTGQCRGGPFVDMCRKDPATERKRRRHLLSKERERRREEETSSRI